MKLKSKCQDLNPICALNFLTHFKTSYYSNLILGLLMVHFSFEALMNIISNNEHLDAKSIALAQQYFFFTDSNMLQSYVFYHQAHILSLPYGQNVFCFFLPVTRGSVPTDKFISLPFICGLVYACHCDEARQTDLLLLDIDDRYSCVWTRSGDRPGNIQGLDCKKKNNQK